MDSSLDELIQAFRAELGERLRLVWHLREEARRRAKEQSGRGAATAGKHLEPVEALLRWFIKQSGLTEAMFYSGPSAILPGYFRPVKTWDLVAVHRGALAVAIELKSQFGSWGNNFNNRVEEALGSALDLEVCLREGALTSHVPEDETGIWPPFRGWFMVLPWEEKALRPTRLGKEPLFPLDPVFLAGNPRQLASYADRYKAFVKRVMLSRLYDAAALVFTTPQSTAFDDFNLDFFLRKLALHSRELAKSG